jgi:predicted benzoate:H+ symporter BenE
LSNMTLLGLGPFFWSLVLGATTSLLFERDGWKQLHAEILSSEEPNEG